MVQNTLRIHSEYSKYAIRGHEASIAHSVFVCLSDVFGCIRLYSDVF